MRRAKSLRLPRCLMKLLIVEDEKRMVELLQKGLTEEGHTVECATDGNAGLELATNCEFDVIILDIMMPKLSGYELAKRLRSDKISTPLLMLTAKDSVQDIVFGLNLGADDYMTKPFSFNELLARLQAVKRRARVPQLTRTEYNLLEQLMYRAGRVVRRRSLVEAVWGFDRDIETNTLDAFIRLLRNKVDNDARLKLIHTVRGVGYVLRAEPVNR